MESRGDANAVGPVGSVGLMQVMPKERASHGARRRRLLNPCTNLFWGTRTLATVIQQGDGDVFSALAAYNGGWEKGVLAGPQGLCCDDTSRLRRAVAVRHGAEGAWSAFIRYQDSGSWAIWVTNADSSDVYHYADVNVTPEGNALIPAVAPTSVLASCIDLTQALPTPWSIWLYCLDSGAVAHDQYRARRGVGARSAASRHHRRQLALNHFRRLSRRSRLRCRWSRLCRAPSPPRKHARGSLDGPATTPTPEPVAHCRVANSAGMPIPPGSFNTEGGLECEGVRFGSRWRLRLRLWNIEDDVKGSGFPRNFFVLKVHSARRASVIVGGPGNVKQ